MLAIDLDLHFPWDLEPSTVNQPWWRRWEPDGQNHNSCSLRETIRSGFYRLQLPFFFFLNHLRFTAMDHFFGLWVFLKGPQQSRNWPWTLSFVCSDLTLLVNLGTLLNPKAKSLWQTPGFVIPVLPCAISPELCVASLAFQAGHSPEAPCQPLAPVCPWLHTLKWELSGTYTSIQSGGPAASLSQGENFHSCPFSGHWMLIQILWMSEFCLSLEFLISSSSFSDLVLISFYIAFSLENVCSIQASAYSLLLNTQVNIHCISVALFSSSCNKLSCLLMEATMSPYWTPGFACACKIPLNLSSSPVPPHLDCFL